MTALYKLTTREWTTKNNTLWGPNVTHKTSGKGELCGPGWLHAYLSPELAVLLNPIHADITDAVLWEAEGDIGATDGQLKVGCASLTTIRIIPTPMVTLEHRVRFAILCANAVYDAPKFSKWAKNWLSGKDRSAEAARSAAWSAEAAEAEAGSARSARSAAWSAEAAAAAEAIDLVGIAKEAFRGVP